MTQIDIAFVGTELFYDNYFYPISYLDRMKSVCESVWNDITDGSGDYSANFDRYTSSQIEIPEDELCTVCVNNDDEDQVCSGSGYCSFRGRLNQADSWLDANEYSMYYNHDVIIIADYHPQGDGGLRGAAQSEAGGWTDKCCMLDLKEITNEVYDSDSPWRNIGYGGIAAHELVHMFLDGNEHENASVGTSTDNTGTIMYDSDASSWCSGNITNGMIVEEEASSCTITDVRNWIDDNGWRL